MLASPPPATSDAAAPDLVRFVARLARPAPAATAYTEVRFLHQLTRPLVLHGELEYDGPGKLGKRVDAPYREATTVSDGTATVTRAGRAPQRFELARAPELDMLLGGFSALLGGDARALQKFYVITLVDNAPNWTLTMVPHDSALAVHLRAFVIDGRATQPSCFTLERAHGDSSVMLLGVLATTELPQPPTPAALSALCRAAP
ncbi:MAG: LolA-related protein [Rudaea sp.]